MKFTVYTDGGARGNPGLAGVGAVIADEKGQVMKRVSKFLGEQTNNWAEYEAVIVGLLELKKLIPEKERAQTHIELRLDSELVAKQLRGEYQIKDEPLQLQYMKIHNIRVASFPHLSVVHIPREENAAADALANEAMDSGIQNSIL